MVRASETPMVITEQGGPTPGTSGEGADGYMPMDSHSDNADSVIEVPDETSKPSKKRKAAEMERESPPRYDPTKFKNKKPKTQQQTDKRAEFLESISESLGAMANFVNPPPEETTEEDYDLSWAKILVPKLKMMPLKVKEKFKVHIDSLAVDAINEEWP